MKKILALTSMLVFLSGSAQNATVTYSAATGNVTNPERGFYKHTETHSTGYSSLNQTTLTNYRVNEGITLVLRVFYLENFIATPISSTYLTSIQSDFAKIRAAGLKCIVRFAYSDDNDNGAPQDATKAQVLAHIDQLKPILLANSDIIPVMQAGFIGAWGEWYYTTNFGMSPTAADYQNRKDVVNALLNALPPGKMVQMRTPALKQNTYTTPSALSLTQAYTNTNVARVGHHNDCFLASSSDYGTYQNIAAEYPYLEQETKFLPMGGETCAINLPRSGCQVAINEMSKFHWSYLNLDYHPGVLDGFESSNCFGEIQNRLGYRFELVNGTYPQTAQVGSIMPVTINIKNSGFATPFNARNTFLILRNTVTGIEHSIAINSDVRFWSAATQQTLVENIVVPSNVVAGTYKLMLHMPDIDPALSSRGEYAIRLANNIPWDGNKGYNDLQHTVNISGALGIDGNNAITSQLTVYPVPAHNELNLEYNGISDFDVSVHNALGQQVNLPKRILSLDKLVVNTQSLSNGIYFVSLEKGQQKEIKRISLHTKI